MTAMTWDQSGHIDRPERADRTRERWSLLASAVLHALLLVWLILFQPHASMGESLTEITLLDAGDSGAPESAPATPASAPQPSPGEVAVASERNTHFERASTSAEIAPQPQDVTVAADRLNARLAALQTVARAPSTGALTASPASLWGSAPATLPGSGGSGVSPVALNRGGSGVGPALSLTRGGGGAGPATALTAATVTPRREASPEPEQGNATLRRTLAGATLMGPIADRRVLNQVKPLYPDWAMRDAVEGVVTLYFVVRPDGSVRENVVIQKTAGFEEFDENARTAIRAWRFEPLREGRTGDQWGTITFNFRLREGG